HQRADPDHPFGPPKPGYGRPLRALALPSQPRPARGRDHPPGAGEGRRGALRPLCRRDHGLSRLWARARPRHRRPLEPFRHHRPGAGPGRPPGRPRGGRPQPETPGRWPRPPRPGTRLVPRSRAAGLSPHRPTEPPPPDPRDACGACRSCHQIETGAHPDVTILTATSGKGETDQTREIESRFIYRPLIGRRKIVILDNADLLRREAANALLKTIEEP